MLTQRSAIPRLDAMEVHLTPELAAKLDKLAAETGRAKDEFRHLGFPAQLEQVHRAGDVDVFI